MSYTDRKTPAILITDDNQDILTALTLLLGYEGYQISTAQSVSESLELIKQKNFDLYVMDSWLPDGSGLDLCRQIRVRDEDVPIVFYSGDGYDKDRISAMDAGAQAYILKPGTINDLEDVISDLIRKRDYAA